MERGGPLRGEAAALREFWELTLDPVYLGLGLPRGDGRLVLVLPGLFGSDFWRARGSPVLGWLRLSAGEVTSVIEVNRRGCSSCVARGVRATFAYPYCSYGLPSAS